MTGRIVSVRSDSWGLTIKIKVQSVGIRQIYIRNDLKVSEVDREIRKFLRRWKALLTWKKRGRKVYVV